MSDLFEEEKPSKDFTQSVYRPRPQNISSQIYQERPKIPAVEKEINYRFYELYAYRECNDAEEDIKIFTDLSNIKKVTPEQNEAMKGKISVMEASNYLNTLNNNKAPGRTGFTAAFYKFFWSRISHIITNAINYCFQIKELPLNQTIGVICLLTKADKNPY